MKLKKLPLLLVPFMLTSCGAVPSLSIEAARQIISNFANATYNEYFIEAELNIAGIPASDNSYVSYQAETFDDTSRSYYLGAPMRLTSDNFYIEITKTNPNTGVELPKELDKNNCVYGIIHSILIFASGSLSTITLEDNNQGGLIFSTYNSDTFLTINHVNEFDPTIPSIGNFAGRINGQFEYNNEGYLIREEVWSIHYDEAKVNKDPSMLHIYSTYQYQ